MNYIKGYDSWKLMTPEEDRSGIDDIEDPEKGRMIDLEYESRIDREQDDV